MVNGKEVKIGFDALLHLRIVEPFFNVGAIQGIVDTLWKWGKVVLGVRVLDMRLQRLTGLERQKIEEGLAKQVPTEAIRSAAQ